MPTVNAICHLPLGICNSKGQGLKAKGFSLIELLIVITLFGFASGLITIGYVGFEKKQTGKNAAAAFKGDIRFAQNQSGSGVKDPTWCAATTRDATGVLTSSVLVGYFVEVLTTTGGANNTYNIKGLCVNTYKAGYGGPCLPQALVDSSVECSWTYKTVALPTGVTFITSISNSADARYVFFQPLKSEPALYSSGSQITSFVNQTISNWGGDPQLNVTNLVPAGNGLTFSLNGPDTQSNLVTVSTKGDVQ